MVLSVKAYAEALSNKLCLENFSPAVGTGRSCVILTGEKLDQWQDFYYVHQLMSWEKKVIPRGIVMACRAFHDVESIMGRHRNIKQPDPTLYTIHVKSSHNAWLESRALEVNTEADVDKAADIYNAMIKDELIPSLDKYKSLAAVHAHAEDLPLENKSKFIHHPFTHRFMILKFMVGAPDAVEYGQRIVINTLAKPSRGDNAHYIKYIEALYAELLEAYPQNV